MADLDDIKDGKDWGADSPADTSQFFLKGAAHHDWGMKARLSQIFRPETGRTVMLAFDHGYFQGPTTGLERIDLTIAPLAQHTDVLMCTRGALRSVIPPDVNKPVVLRCSAGNSILTELSNELVSVDIEDAIRLGASGMAAQVYIGAEFEHKSIANVVKLIDTGTRYGIPTMAVTGVGADMVRDARYFGLATRIAAEIGSQFVKSYFVEDGFEKITLGCPVPIVIAGGKKLPERDALEMAYRAINQGAAGVDMGRNVFQSENPVAMLKALEAVVHHDATGAAAYELFQDSGAS
ncbi:MAG: 3-hydroxy-5-phosphonooxypentane-2,4-dione thiolase [Sedimentitalea sp.]|uniref:3-hydroxy-5-phosphonooxypentane-2,4-dione thiolase n=1 Tax=Sedimentitalea sp. TaxID=2048915 RepID=UPI0032647805